MRVSAMMIGTSSYDENKKNSELLSHSRIYIGQ